MIIGKNSAWKGFLLFLAVIVVIATGALAVCYAQEHSFAVAGWILAALNAAWGGWFVYELYSLWIGGK